MIDEFDNDVGLSSANSLLVAAIDFGRIGADVSYSLSFQRYTPYEYMFIT